MSGDTFSWNGGGGSFADPNMWTDLTDPTNTGTLAPIAGDTAIFSSGGDVSDGGTAGVLQIEADVSFAGLVNAGDLTVDAMNVLTASAGFTVQGVTLDGTLLSGATGYFYGPGTISADGSLALNSSGHPPDFGVVGSLSVAGEVSGAFRLLISGDIEIAGSQATLTTHAPGPGFSTAGNIIVGIVGTKATIDVSNGGSVDSDNVFIGVQDEPGLAIVDAAHWTNSGMFEVGDNQLGTLVVKNAGTIDTNSFDINISGPGGTATLQDAGSLLLASDGMDVGTGGTLLVTTKAFLDTSAGFEDNIGSFVSNPDNTTDPLVQITNGGTWHGGSIELGPGTLEVKSGTLVSAALTIAGSTDVSGVASESGSGSSWTNAGSIIVGSRGDGTLSLESSASLGVGGDLIGGELAASTGTITLDGATTTLTVTGTTEVGKAGTATFKVANSAAATMAVLIIAAQPTSGTNDTPDMATADGTGSTLSVTGNATIDSATPLDTNTFDLPNGTFGSWSYSDSGVGQLIASDGGYVSIGGTLMLQASNSSDTPAAVNITGGGSMEVGGTGNGEADFLVVDDGGLVTGYGTITMDADGEVFANAGGTVDANQGTLELNANVGGDGVFTIEANATLKIDGSVDAGTLIMFNDAGGATNYSTTLALKTPEAFAGTIENFAQGDTIYLPNFQPSSDLIGVNSFIDGLSIQGVGTIELTGHDPVPTIGFKQDINGGTDIETVNLQTLHDLAFDTYHAPFAGADGYSEIAIAPADSGFEAVAYKDSNTLDGDPSIVVAFRGTFTQQIPAFVKNIVADSSFLLGLPNGLLQRYVSDAANFLAQIVSGFPTAQIMLAGHSLGGGIAQLVGEASGFGTAAFNAPGTGQLFATLGGQLSPADNLGDGGTNINYRVTGDQASFGGLPMRQTYSLPSTVGTNGATPFITAMASALTNHSAFPNLQSSTFTEGFTDPDFITNLQSFLQGPGGVVLHITLQVVAGLLGVVDPGPGSSFVLAADPGAPDISQIVLPQVPGVASYELAYQIGNTTSAFSQVQPGATTDLPAGVNAVTFDPLDASNAPIVIPSSFYLGIACATSGTFTGTLTESNSTEYAGPVTTNVSLRLEPDAVATPLGIPTPTDPSDSDPADFGAVVTALPNDATVTLVDGTTPVTLHEALTTAQLAGLKVAPNPDMAGASSTFTYMVTDAEFASANGTATIDIACFLEGTRILTEYGEVAVEHLQPGMRVISLAHQTLLPIIWLGHCRMREAWPVRIAAHAFGPNQPHHDLWLSPDHALFIDGALIPVRYLINGVTIAQQRCDKVCYYHVELAAHGILLAEGLPAESYLDTGNRSAFEHEDQTVAAIA